MARMMQQGASGLQDMSDAVSQNLILTEEARQKALEYQANVDQLSDSFDGLSYVVGQTVVSALNTWIEGIANSISLTDVQTKQVAYLNMALENGTLTYDAYIAKATELGIPLEALKKDFRDTADAEMEAAKATDHFMTTLDILNAAIRGEATQALDSYNSGMSDLQDEADQLKQKLGELQADGVDKNKKAIEDTNRSLEENINKQKGLEKQLDRTISKLIYQSVASHMDEGAQRKLALSLGLINQKEYTFYETLDKINEKYDTNKDGIIDSKEATQEYIDEVKKLKDDLEKLPDQIFIDIYTNYHSTGTPPATGGGTTTTSGGHEQGQGGPGGYASGGVSSGPTSGHYELLHGTEYILTQNQFGDMVRAISNIANGAGAGGGPTYVTVNYSGSNFSELLQSIEMAAARKY